MYFQKYIYLCGTFYWAGFELNFMFYAGNSIAIQMCTCGLLLNVLRSGNSSVLQKHLVKYMCILGSSQLSVTSHSDVDYQEV